MDRRASFPGVHETVDANQVSLFGFVVSGVSPYEIGEEKYDTFAFAISGASQQPGAFPIDYRYRTEDLPVESLLQLENAPDARSSISGKRVVISAAANTEDDLVLIPTKLGLPTIYVAILAAETLSAGPPVAVDLTASTLLPFIVIAFAIFMRRQERRKLYLVCGLALFFLPYILAPFGVIVPTGNGIVLLLLYLAFRARAAWMERAAGMERLSGLPNFHALEDDYAARQGRLVVAKIENYEAILASLEPASHSIFVRQIGQRLSIGGSNRIYTDTTGHFAWFDDLEHARSHVAGLLALTNSPIRIGDRTLDFSASFGLLDCEIGKARQAISATVVAAEQAATRRTQIAFVSEQDGFDANWQLSLLASLDAAIKREQIYLLYQPQRSFADGSLVGCEALVRWRHPERGVISPSQFIPQIERAGRLKPLTAHTLRLAARASRSFEREGLRISVNVSATMIADDDFPAFIEENVLASGGRPEAITIEVTETAKIPDLDRAANNLGKLQSRGFHIALDDFGTGEANLSLLVALPCDELKIDRSFVVLAQHSDRARMVIGALAQTTNRSGMRLVAEGIETEDDRVILSELGCEIGQGYFFGRPQPLVSVLEMLDQQAETPPEKLTLY
ncbi:EAL domain-containing protein [Croceicoccus naphthovorans]|nr:EAL domain-containing protein [Croceicoccus naphthovorans]MBB3990653.1 EAL domain-containing protein (putative c-di-GMP-specific phosphodiesterase class I) [Croceicoccus naphthovorans]